MDAASDMELSGQLEQGEEPVVDLNVPARQAVHGAPSGPVYPSLQTHAVSEILVDGDVESSGQSEHGEEPLVFL